MRYIVPQEKLGLVMAAAYARSSPQGLGFLHARSGEIDENFFNDDIARAINADPANPYLKGLSMDYVLGRSCKFHIQWDEAGWFVDGPRWYDHTESQFLDLVQSCGLVERPQP